MEAHYDTASILCGRLRKSYSGRSTWAGPEQERLADRIEGVKFRYARRSRVAVPDQGIGFAAACTLVSNQQHGGVKIVRHGLLA